MTAQQENPRSAWGTPDWFYKLLNEEFHFTLDAAASAENTKCGQYFTRNDNALNQDWGKHVVFVNPPYGGPRAACKGKYLPEATLGAWNAKASTASNDGATVALLMPSDTGTEWMCNAGRYAREIRLITPRIEFAPEEGIKESGNRGPSALIVYRPGPIQSPAKVWFWDLNVYKAEGQGEADK